MIYGRSTALYLGFVAAALNVCVGVFNVPLNAAQLSALNGLAFAVVGLVANVSATGTAFGKAASRYRSR